jgi:hypothetical protein
MKRIEQQRATQPSRISSDRPIDQNLDREEQVRRRAYEIYEQRGTVAGSEIEDWLQAEAEILSVPRVKEPGANKVDEHEAA